MATASAERAADCLTESRAVRIVAAQLASAERLQVEQHIAACADCRRMMSEVLGDSATDRVMPRFQPRVLGTQMVLADRYRIRRFLGMGAMGEVHEAEDLLLGKIVAVKTLNARLLGSDKAIARLKREVAAAHRVTHPNVCRIFDLGIDCHDKALGALMFITMELLEGPTLAVLLGEPALGDDERSEVLRQLASGLAAAHAAGVIHRDLKPENVMVTRNPDGAVRAVITDFGLAGLGGPTDAVAGSGLSGTAAYAAPERMRGAPATPASDVYSLGLIAHEVLCRRRLLGAAPDIRAVPLKWRVAIGRALESDATGRPADAGCLLTAFQATRRSSRARSFWLAAGTAAALAALSSLVMGVGVPPAAAPQPDPAKLHPVIAASPRRAEASAPVPFFTPDLRAPPPPKQRRSAPTRVRRARASVPPAPAAVGLPAGADRLIRDVSFDSPPGHEAGNLLNPF